jgi:hypothetical protein
MGASAWADSAARRLSAAIPMKVHSAKRHGLPYSLRKRKLIRSGQPVMLLVHAGIHFNSILAWLATVAMIINVVSGLTD